MSYYNEMFEILIIFILFLPIKKKLIKFCIHKNLYDINYVNY